MSGSALQLENHCEPAAVADRDANALLVWRGSHHDHAGESVPGIRKPCGRQHAPGSADFTHANGINNVGDVVGDHGCPDKLGCGNRRIDKALANEASGRRSGPVGSPTPARGSSCGSRTGGQVMAFDAK